MPSLQAPVIDCPSFLSLTPHALPILCTDVITPMSLGEEDLTHIANDLSGRELLQSSYPPPTPEQEFETPAEDAAGECFLV
mgnify:FL=1